MQSLRRRIMRGNSVVVENTVTKQMEVVDKKGTPKKVWNRAKKDRMLEFEQAYCNRVVQSINKN